MTDKKKLTPKMVPQDQSVLVRSQSSCLVKMDKDGKMSFELKAYADTTKEAVDEAMKYANELFQKLTTKVEGKIK